jgi:DedD protein
MIRLPKFFKRDPKGDDLRRGPVGARRATTKIPARTFQRAQEHDDLALTEDPERQRARHRLIGATVLVLIAVIGLPRILDNKPKASSNDIAVNIITSQPAPVETLPVTEKVKTNVPAAKEAPVNIEANSSQSTANSEVKEESKQGSKSAPTPPTSSKNNGLGLAAGEEVIAAPAKPRPDDAPKKPASTGKYVVQIGAFASEERAKGWIAKLKDQKIPYVVTNKTGADGAKLFVLRAGPFTDKEVAESAEKKIKALGLSPRLVEMGTP